MGIPAAHHAIQQLVCATDGRNIAHNQVTLVQVSWLDFKNILWNLRLERINDGLEAIDSSRAEENWTACDWCDGGVRLFTDPFQYFLIFSFAFFSVVNVKERKICSTCSIQAFKNFRKPFPVCVDELNSFLRIQPRTVFFFCIARYFLICFIVF